VGKDPVVPSETPQAGFTSDRPAAQPQSIGGVSTPATAVVSPRQKSENSDGLAGSYAAKPAPPAMQQGSAAGTAAAVASSSGAGPHPITTDAGVEQLLAEERAAHVGPSDQPSAVYKSSNNANSSHDSRAAVTGTRQGQQQGLQSPPQQQQAVLLSKQRAAGSAGASPFATTAERPASPIGRAETAPPTATGRHDIPLMVQCVLRQWLNG
jgi:hypothetical protein